MPEHRPDVLVALLEVPLDPQVAARKIWQLMWFA
jgi:hypothetical protein